MRTEGLMQVLEERRRIAARMFEQGMEPKLIAQLMDAHPQTVRAWQRI